MKTSLGIATLVVVGAGAIGAGAATFTTSPYQGSDTLYNITNQAIANSNLGTFGNYVGGGSGAGENAMTAATPGQETAPMSKMLTSQTCTIAAGNSTTAGYSHATGMVIGLDGAEVFSSTTTGAAAACNGTADNTGTGLNYNVGGFGFQNWTDVLALLYGGMDKSSSFCVGGTAPASTPCTPGVNVTATCGTGGSCTPLTDCNSTKRQSLVANWSNLFQNGCAEGNTTCTTAALPLGANTLSIGGELWHAFRRDDNSGTADVFASLIGLGQLTDTAGKKTIKASVSSSALHGFGTTPYCNALNWDTVGNTSTTGCDVAGGGLGPNKQYFGPGGIPDPAAGDASHRRPPPKAWGDTPDPSQSPYGAAALPTSYQDNDPIRRKCIGKNSVDGVNPMEEVCNTDGQLGLVLPVPAVDFIPKENAGRVAFNTANCTGFISGKNFSIAKCAPAGTNASACPSGDVLIGGGCFFPKSAAGSSLCENNPPHWPTIHKHPTGDARIFNTFVFNGGNSYTFFAIPAAGASLAFAGAYARLHEQVPLYDQSAAPACNANSDCPTTAPQCYGGTAGASPPTGFCGPAACQEAVADDAIGCLVQADPCSVGFGADGAKTWGSRASTPVASNIDSLRLSQVYPNTASIQGSVYPLWRKLYFNSSLGFDNAALANTDELALAQYESNAASITPLLLQYGEFALGKSPIGGAGSNTPFCEDFNETLLCGATAAPTNLNACNYNTSSTNNAENPGSNTAVTATGTALSAFAAVPGDTSSNPAAASTSTVCGNAVTEDFEECDNGTPGTANAVNGGNGSPGNPCSALCRTVLP